MAADVLAVLDGHGVAAAHIVGARLAVIPGMGHGFFSPGIATLILEHTAPVQPAEPVADAS